MIQNTTNQCGAAEPQRQVPGSSELAAAIVATQELDWTVTRHYTALFGSAMVAPIVDSVEAVFTPLTAARGAINRSWRDAMNVAEVLERQRDEAAKREAAWQTIAKGLADELARRDQRARRPVDARTIEVLRFADMDWARATSEVIDLATAIELHGVRS